MIRKSSCLLSNTAILHLLGISSLRAQISVIASGAKQSSSTKDVSCAQRLLQELRKGAAIAMTGGRLEHSKCRIAVSNIFRRSIAPLFLMAALCGKASPGEDATRKNAQEMYYNTLSVRAAVRHYVSSMDDGKKAAMLFLVNINGFIDFRPVEEYIPGGYLFFRYNIADTAQGVKDFASSIRDWCVKHGEALPYLAVDQEGGDVQRLRGIAPPLPSQSRVSSEMTLDEAGTLYYAQANAMQSMGFHLNLAPVAEALNSRNRDVLGTRSYGSALDAAHYGKVCIASYKKGGISCAIKHFPGNASADPHTGQSAAEVSEEEIALEIAPFMQLIRFGAEAAVMSHIRLNGECPACFSGYWVNMLRNEGFQGLIISDDIFMAAVADGYTPEEAAIKAIEAGADVIMISEKRFYKPLMAITEKMKSEKRFASRVEESCIRVVLFKLHHGILNMDSIK